MWTISCSTAFLFFLLFILPSWRGHKRQDDGSTRLFFASNVYPIASNDQLVHWWFMYLRYSDHHSRFKGASKPHLMLNPAWFEKRVSFSKVALYHTVFPSWSFLHSHHQHPLFIRALSDNELKCTYLVGACTSGLEQGFLFDELGPFVGSIPRINERLACLVRAAFDGPDETLCALNTLLRRNYGA